MLSKSHFDCAKDFLDRNSVPARWAQSPRQGRTTLRVTDATGSAMGLCVTMDAAPRLMQAFEKHQNGCPQRLDPVQIAAPDIQATYDFNTKLGVRLTDYVAKDGTDDLWSVSLQRKGTPHDVVFSNGRSPHLQHYAVPKVRDPIDARNVAVSLADAAHLERGSGQPGIGNALFVYFHDLDDCRIKVFNTHQRCTRRQLEDIEQVLGDHTPATSCADW